MEVDRDEAPDEAPDGAPSGVDAFIEAVSLQAGLVPDNAQGKVRFVLRIGEDYAFIRMRDVWRPRRFLGQMAGVPPIQFGTRGFDSAIVDDSNPARHYTAFVFVGFWLPGLLAILFLWAWEGLGFVRYRGLWSRQDIACGYVGIRHGRLVRRYGPHILPGLIAGDVAAPPSDETGLGDG